MIVIPFRSTVGATSDKFNLKVKADYKDNRASIQFNDWEIEMSIDVFHELCLEIDAVTYYAECLNLHDIAG